MESRRSPPARSPSARWAPAASRSRRPSSGSGAARGTTAYTVETDGIRFTESGTISFGEGGEATLSFTTLGYGYLLPPADPETGLTPGIVMWKIESGTGFLAGATGLIASNFRVDLNTQRLIDDHVAYVRVPDGVTT